MKIKECCYNCRRSCGCDYEYGVFCFKLKEIRDEDGYCEDYAPESFCADPYE